MFRSFFQKLKEGLGRMPLKKRVVAAGTLALGAAAIIGGTGPLMAEAARTSAAGAGTALVGKSGTPGSSPFGPVEPGYILVTPMESEKSIRATSAGDSDPLMVNPDYTLLMDASEVSSAVYIPDQNHASLLFIPRMTWNNETGMNGNNSAWWVQDGSKNPGRDCSRYETWLLRMNTGNDTASTAAESASQKLVLSASDAKNESAFNNIVFCELEEAMLKKDGKEIGSAKVGNSFENLKKKGVYRERIYEYIKDSKKNTDEYGYYDFDQLAGMTKDEADAFINKVVFNVSKKSGKTVNKSMLKSGENKNLLVPNARFLRTAPRPGVFFCTQKAPAAIRPSSPYQKHPFFLFLIFHIFPFLANLLIFLSYPRIMQ